MAQFVIFFAHAMQPLFIECDYPKVTMMMMMVMMMMVVMMVMMMVMIMVVMMVMMIIIIISHDILFGHPQIYCWIILGHGVLYFCLFSNFYSKSYMSKAKDRSASDIYQKPNKFK